MLGKLIIILGLFPILKNLITIKFSRSWEYIFKIGIFSIPTKVAWGFEIFKQNRDNPNEIGMGGLSASGKGCNVG